MENEIWKPIFAYDGIYEASSLGRIRSVDSVDRLGRVRHGRILDNARMQKRRSTKGGNYLRIRLRHGGKTVNRAVHHLVLEAFVGPRPVGMHGCHRDDDPWNNRVQNLRWDTPSANQRDKIANGTIARGESNGSSKLTEDAVRTILLSPKSAPLLALELGVERETVCRVRRGDLWGWFTSMLGGIRQVVRVRNRKQKTHCPQGHPYSGDNLILENRGTHIARKCRICSRAACNRSHAKANSQ